MNTLNASWTEAARRISPLLLIQLLQSTGHEYSAFIGSLDPLAPAIFSVAWTGETVSLNWLDVAREYTEKWHHQQQIAAAVGKTGRITNRRLYYPVLDTFMRALPFTFRNTPPDDGSRVRVTVTGDAGGDWFVERHRGAWRLVYEADGPTTASVTLDADVGWRVFTKRLDAQTVLERFPTIKIDGNAALGKVTLEMVSIMA